MLLFLIALDHYTCGHDKLIKRLQNVKLQRHKSTIKLKNKSTARTPINIDYNFYFIDNPDKDPYACKKAGDVITIDGQKITCTENDIITESKKKTLKETLGNVKLWYKNTLNVTKFEGLKKDDFEALAYSMPPEYPLPPIDSTDADLFLTVYQRAEGKGSSILAAASSFGGFYTGDNNEERPQVGIIFFNFANMPSEPSNVSDSSRMFFETCLHETVHALGFSSSLYPFWYDKTTKRTKKNVHSVVKSKYAGKTFNVIHTPKLQELVKEKFGITTIDGVNPAGAELEDGGGGGTAGSHFEERTYFTEVMGGVTFGIGVVSQFTLGLLEDTGWYDVNYDQAEPFTYGEYRVVIGQKEPYKDFAFGPPDISFPSVYLSNISIMKCSYDHSFGGAFFVSNYDCAKNHNSPCCKFPTFTDSLKKGICSPSMSILDSIRAIIPSSSLICSKPGNNKNLAFDQKLGPDSHCAVLTQIGGGMVTAGCYEMQCSESNELSITIGTTTHKCESAGEMFKHPTYGFLNVTCPDPKIVCGVKKYVKSFKTNKKPETPKQTPKPTIKPEQTNKPEPVKPKQTSKPVKPKQTSKPVKPKQTSKPVKPVPKPTIKITTDKLTPKQVEPVIVPSKNDDNNIANQESKHSGGKSNTGAIVGGIIAAVIVIVIAAVVAFFGVRYQWCKKEDSDENIVAMSI